MLCCRCCVYFFERARELSFRRYVFSFFLYLNIFKVFMVFFIVIFVKVICMCDFGLSLIVFVIVFMFCFVMFFVSFRSRDDDSSS